MKLYWHHIFFMSWAIAAWIIKLINLSWARAIFPIDSDIALWALLSFWTDGEIVSFRQYEEQDFWYMSLCWQGQRKTVKQQETGEWSI